MPNPISQLKSLKKNPEAGWVSDSKKQDARAQLFEAIEHSDNTEIVYSPKDAVAYYRWMFGDLVSKPLAASVAIFVLLLGGWMTSVSAASTSLPGDTLYSLKLVTESARLKLASREHRAVLHTEYAQRRYEEVVAISKIDSPEMKAHVEKTLTAFHEQIDLANFDLQKLQENGSEEGVFAASEVGKKIDELNAVIEDTTVGSPKTETVAQVTEALDATQEVSNSATDVIVGAHESSEGGVTDSDLGDLFRKEYSELRAREAFDLGRLKVVTNTMQNQADVLEGIDLPIGESFNVIEHEITNATSTIPEAMNLFAAGGYKAAFNLLKQADKELLGIENRLALVEITILNALSESQKVTEVTEASEVTEVIEVIEEDINLTNSLENIE